MSSPRVEGDTKVHTAVIDWDGTAVPSMWPERAMEFMPGFVKSMNRLHKAGIRAVISSARLSPWDPWTGLRRDPGFVAEEYQYVRDMLDRAGLGYIDIWMKEGKPGGSVYVDDKAERYGGRAKSWDRVTDRILMRLGKEDPHFPYLLDLEAV